QGQREEERSIDDERLGEPQPQLVERVVRRLAVRLQGDERREVAGNRIAMMLHMARLAQREPRAPEERGEHEAGEHGGAGSAAHGPWGLRRGRDTIGATRDPEEPWPQPRRTRPRSFG